MANPNPRKLPKMFINYLPNLFTSEAIEIRDAINARLLKEIEVAQAKMEAEGAKIDWSKPDAWTERSQPCIWTEKTLPILDNKP